MSFVKCFVKAFISETLSIVISRTVGGALTKQRNSELSSCRVKEFFLLSIILKTFLFSSQTFLLSIMNSSKFHLHC